MVVKLSLIVLNKEHGLRAFYSKKLTRTARLNCKRREVTRLRGNYRMRSCVICVLHQTLNFYDDDIKEN